MQILIKKSQYKTKKSGKSKMPKKTAYIPINYMVSRFQRGIEPNCGGSRFGENQKSKFFYLIKKYFYEVKIFFSLHEFFLS